LNLSSFDVMVVVLCATIIDVKSFPLIPKSMHVPCE